MKRYRKSGNNSFVRYGLRQHTVRARDVYRGGKRL